MRLLALAAVVLMGCSTMAAAPAAASRSTPQPPPIGSPSADGRAAGINTVACRKGVVPGHPLALIRTWGSPDFMVLDVQSPQAPQRICEKLPIRPTASEIAMAGAKASHAYSLRPMARLAI